jgi:hypothetical protein
MTFIASVIAKKGVAIIADSLVTSQLPILHFRKFIDYLNAQPENPDTGEKVINPTDIVSLFGHEPVYTKDFEEKLFELNRYTAITTTGVAYINDQSIADLIVSFKNNQPDLTDLAVPFQDKLAAFSAFLNLQIREHLGKYASLGDCTFIVTYYEQHTHKTHVVKAIIKEVDSTTLQDPQFNYVTLNSESEYIKVVCDGQNRISDKVLYGGGKMIYEIFPTMVMTILGKLRLPAGVVIPPDFIQTLMNDQYFTDIFYKDTELFNLTELSVQQAVDLASLLMRLEVDFQKYTKNIPTVGGVIKLAVIDEHGFRFISGDKIEPPKHINL